MKKPASNAAQRKLILDYMREHNRLSTLQSREVLGVMAPAPRIFELRKQGFEIRTDWEWQVDCTGARHLQGVYTLLGGGDHAEG